MIWHLPGISQRMRNTGKLATHQEVNPEQIPGEYNNIFEIERITLTRYIYIELALITYVLRKGDTLIR